MSGKLIYFTLSALDGFNDSDDRQIFFLHLVKTTFQIGGVREKLTLYVVFRGSEMYQITPISVRRVQVWLECKYLNFAVENVGNLNLLTVENLAVVSRFNSEFAEPFCLFCHISDVYLIPRAAQSASTCALMSARSDRNAL